MDSLKYIQEKFEIDLEQKSPIKLPIGKYRGLTSLFNELGCKVGAEIGVNRGKFSKWLCHKVRPLKLFLIDPYLSYQEYGEYSNQDGLDAIYEEAQVRLARYNCEFVKKKSMDAIGDFNDNSLDFVYIDANHAFEFVVNDIAEWSKKVKSGGIVSGHDYTNYMREVKIAVDGWVQVKRIKPWFLTGHACWFWIKQ